MSTERDQGFAALQQGDTATAIAQLEAASQNDPNDYQTHLYLGAAYGMTERHQDAVRVLTQAVTLEPGNAQARYNLGVALERAGWPEQAATALEQAITLQPDYPKAQEALQKLRGTAAAPAPPVVPVAPVAETPTQAMPPQSYAPPQTLYGTPEAQPTQAMTPPPYSAPTPPPYGGQPAAYGQPPAPSVYSPNPYPGQQYPQIPYFEDKFSIGQAFRDWVKVLTKPRAFFSEQVGREGYNGPISFLMTCIFFVFAVGIVMGSLGMAFSGGAMAGFGVIGVIIGLVIYGGMVFVGSLVGNFIAAGFYHLASKLFGNQTNYSTSFRALTYAQGASWAAVLLGMLLLPFMLGPVMSEMNRSINEANTRQTRTTRTPSGGGFTMDRPGATGNPNDMFGSASSRRNRSTPPDFGSGVTTLSVVMWVVYGASAIYYLVLLGMGLAHLQKLTTGGAVGTVILGSLIPIALIIGLVMMLVAVFAGMAAGVH